MDRDKVIRNLEWGCWYFAGWCSGCAVIVLGSKIIN